jgi:nitric oxide reductase subunit B
MSIPEGRRDLLVSRAWVQVVGLVLLFGFFVLGLLAYRTYQEQPPVPSRVVDPGGHEIYTAADVEAGQKLFLRYGLMQYGSIFGHGAYLGPDFTADYLHRAALDVREQYGGERSDRARTQTIEDFRTNRYSDETNTLELTEAQAGAFERVRDHYANFFGGDSNANGLPREAITNPDEIHQLTAYFAWSAWAASAERPGHDYSYTNNWPPEPLVDNGPTANVIVWSVLSLIALLGGIGILFGAFGRWRVLGWHGREQATLSFRSPGDVALTPAQRATAWFFFVMAALFLVQTMVGAASPHYRADLASFFGINLAAWLPFNLMRTWHVQLAIFFVATSYVAAGIFLAPMIARREPRGQHILAFGLLAALALVVGGSMLGELAGIHGWTSGAAEWFGNQGWEYLDLGRFWQILLSLGIFAWVFMLWRVLRTRLRGEHKGNMPWLFFFAALAIPVFYAVGLLARDDSTFTTADFWPSGSSTYGSRTSSSCSPPSWSRTSSCCLAWSASGSR